ncbi:MAG: SGNH/GDSL hydrolase family protein [Nitrospirota bacterium]
MSKVQKRSPIASTADAVLLGTIFLILLGFVYTWTRKDVLGMTFIFYGACELLGVTAYTVAYLVLKESIRINLALVTVSVGVTILSSEIVLSLVQTDVDDRVFAARLAGAKFDQRSKFELIDNLKASGVQAVPSITPRLWAEGNAGRVHDGQLIPLSGLSKRVTVFCNEGGEFATYESDEHGFNNPIGLYQKGKVDVVLIGDSFAHGACVKQGEDIASHLRAYDIRALNLGMAGSGPLIELAILTEYAEPVAPRIVLWMYFEENDQYNLVREQTFPFFLRYLDRQFKLGLFDQQDKIDTLLLEPFLAEAQADVESEEEERRQREGIRGQKWAKILRLYHLRTRLGVNKPASPPSTPPPSDLFSKILAEARNRALAWGGRMYFVYIPDYTRYNQTHRDHDSLFHRAGVLEAVQKLGIPIIDVHEFLSHHPDPLSLYPLRVHGHFNAQGYRLIANYLQQSIDEIETRFLVPPANPTS